MIIELSGVRYLVNEKLYLNIFVYKIRGTLNIIAA